MEHAAPAGLLAPPELQSAVSDILESQGVLPSLRAQLRQCVFETVDAVGIQRGQAATIASRSNARRDALLRSEHGILALSLVADLLDAAGMTFTRKVFEPEAGVPATRLMERGELFASLGMPLPADGLEAAALPCLVAALQQQHRRNVTHAGPEAAADGAVVEAAGRAPMDTSNAATVGVSAASRRASEGQRPDVVPASLADEPTLGDIVHDKSSGGMASPQSESGHESSICEDLPMPADESDDEERSTPGLGVGEEAAPAHGSGGVSAIGKQADWDLIAGPAFASATLRPDNEVMDASPAPQGGSPTVHLDILDSVIAVGRPGAGSAVSFSPLEEPQSPPTSASRLNESQAASVASLAPPAPRRSAGKLAPILPPRPSAVRPPFADRSSASDIRAELVHSGLLKEPVSSSDRSGSGPAVSAEREIADSARAADSAPDRRWPGKLRAVPSNARWSDSDESSDEQSPMERAPPLQSNGSPASTPETAFGGERPSPPGNLVLEDSEVSWGDVHLADADLVSPAPGPRSV